MIPSNLLALVVLAASIGPGYVWVSVAETRTPRHQRTQLLELAELLIVGGFFSTVSFLAVASFAGWRGWLDTDALATGGSHYVLRHPSKWLLIILVGLLLAAGLAYVAARVRFQHQPAVIEHGYSAWYKMLAENRTRNTYLTVDLRDGTTIAGWFYTCTVEEVPPAERDLVIAAANWKPIKVRPPGGTWQDSRARMLIVNGADILTMVGTYRPSGLRKSEKLPPLPPLSPLEEMPLPGRV